MTKRAWLTKFRQQVEQLPQGEAEQILACVEGAESLSRLKKAQAVTQAIAQLERCANSATVSAVLQGCSCEFSQGRIAAIKRVYDESPSLSEFWVRLHASGLLVVPFEYRDGWLIITQKPYRPDLQAGHPDDPFEWYCHCGSIVKPLHGCLSPAICQCGAGFYRPLFLALFGDPVQIEVRESLLRGDSRCVFAVRVPRDDQSGRDGMPVLSSEHLFDSSP